MAFDMSENEINELAKELEAKLMAFYGSPIITGANLQQALGYRSIYALRQAILRKTFPLPIFSLPNRRGKYVFVKDIALYLAKQSVENEEV